MNWRKMAARSSPLNSSTPAARDVHQLIQRDLAGVAHRGHEHRAVRDAEVHALLRFLAGEEAVGEAGRETVAAADAIFDFEVVVLRAVVELAVGPHDCRPIVYR